MKTIKLCDGWTVLEDGKTVLETEDYQEVRGFLSLSSGSHVWEEITRILFCFGRCTLEVNDTDGVNHIVDIMAIPCKG